MFQPLDVDAGEVGGQGRHRPLQGRGRQQATPLQRTPWYRGLRGGDQFLGWLLKFCYGFFKRFSFEGQNIEYISSRYVKSVFCYVARPQKRKKERKNYCLYLYPLKILIRFWNLFWEEIIIVGFNIFLIKPVSLFHTVYVCTLNNGRELWNWLYKLLKTYKSRTQNNKIFFFKIIFFISLIATLRGFFNEEK